jgi:HEAT repeat protein
MEFEGIEKLQGQVTLNLSRVSIYEGLLKLLADVEYAIVGDVAKDLRQVRVVIFGEQGHVRHHSITANKGNASTSQGNGRAVETAEEAAVAQDLVLEAEPAVEEENQTKRLSALYVSSVGGDTEALKNAIQSPDPLIRSKAFDALSTQDSGAAVEALLAAAQSNEPGIRLHAIQLLDQSGQADESTVLALLREALGNADRTVKGYAIQALAARGGGVAMSYLREALGDPDPSIKSMIIENLGQKDEGSPVLQEVP